MNCPSCDGQKAAVHYLCRGCWCALPELARQRLYRRDSAAGMRLVELHRALRRGVPLAEIEVAA